MITESDINLLDTIYYELSRLLRSEPWLNSCVDDLSDFHCDYLKSEECPLSAETKHQFFLFFESLRSYLKENSFSVDETFVYLDKHWHI
jgi:hypothetical protein